MPLPRFPPELWLKIFGVVRDDAFEERLGKVEGLRIRRDAAHNLRRRAAWFMLPLVCKLWRDVMLNDGMIWTSIDLGMTGFQLAEVMRRRSLKANGVRILVMRVADLYFPSETRYKLGEFMDVVLSTSRTTLMDVTLGSPGASTTLQLLLAAPPLPTLRRLACCGEMSGDHVDNTLALVAPALETLKICNVDLRMSSTGYTFIHLADIDVRMAFYNPPIVVRMDVSVVHALAGLPSLESLTIGDYFPDRLTAKDVTCRFSGPLRNVRLERTLSPATDLASLGSMIQHPSAHRTYWLGAGLEMTDLRICMDILGDQCGLATAAFVDVDTASDELHLHTSRPIPLGGRTSVHFCLLTWRIVFNNPLMSLPIRGLESLTVRDDRYDAMGIWSSFAQCQRLRRIDAIGMSYTGLLSLLQDMPSVFASLKDLFFVSYQRPSTGYLNDVCAGRLASILRLRKKYKIPITTIGAPIKCLRPTEDWVQKLLLNHVRVVVSATGPFSERPGPPSDLRTDMELRLDDLVA